MQLPCYRRVICTNPSSDAPQHIRPIVFIMFAVRSGYDGINFPRADVIHHPITLTVPALISNCSSFNQLNQLCCVCAYVHKQITAPNLTTTKRVRHSASGPRVGSLCQARTKKKKKNTGEDCLHSAARRWQYDGGGE